MDNVLADRGINFKNYIDNLLSRSGLNAEIRQQIIRDGEKIFSAAFTRKEIDSVNNYEFLEQIGDALQAAFFIKYVYTRFPQLQTAEGVKTVSRMRILYCSKPQFAKIGNDLKLTQWISAPKLMLDEKRVKLLEDVFEALIGAISLAGELYYPLFGELIAFKFLESIYNEIELIYDYDSLVDDKTKFKEYLDKNPNISAIIRTNIKYDEQSKQFTHYIYKDKILIGKGSGFKKVDAEQRSSAQALKFLK